MRIAQYFLSSILVSGLAVVAQEARAGTMDEVLAAHNQLRDRHCVGPLVWSPEIAQIASNWANRCEWRHSNSDLGENLWQGTVGGWSPAEQVQDWYNEINNYDFSRGESANGGVVGHFTQVVWRETTQIGCGVAICGGDEMLVCNYAPRGNFAFNESNAAANKRNVPPPCK
jgi:pathogenesis-related protein 1